MDFLFLGAAALLAAAMVGLVAYCDHLRVRP